MRPLNPLILRVLYMLRFCSLITMVLDANTYGFRTQNLWYCKGSLIIRNDSDAGFVDMIINKTGNIITTSPALIILIFNYQYSIWRSRIPLTLALKAACSLLRPVIPKAHGDHYVPKRYRNCRPNQRSHLAPYRTSLLV